MSEGLGGVGEIIISIYYMKKIYFEVRDFIAKCVLWLYEMNKSKHYKLVLKFQIYFCLKLDDICVNYQEIKNKNKY